MAVTLSVPSAVTSRPLPGLTAPALASVATGMAIGVVPAMTASSSSDRTSRSCCLTASDASCGAPRPVTRLPPMDRLPVIGTVPLAMKSPLPSPFEPL